MFLNWCIGAKDNGNLNNPIVPIFFKLSPRLLNRSKITREPCQHLERRNYPTGQSFRSGTFGCQPRSSADWDRRLWRRHRRCHRWRHWKTSARLWRWRLDTATNIFPELLSKVFENWSFGCCRSGRKRGFELKMAEHGCDNSMRKRSI